jgi:hypothetical protein
MTSTNAIQQSLEIFIGELAVDEELRASFFCNPRKTLRLAADWGLPLSDTEVGALLGANQSFWDQVLEGLDDRLQAAA